MAEASKKEEMRVFPYLREVIKPSSPTPSHLQTFKLSPLDQLAPPIHMPAIFFYTGDGYPSTSVGQRLKRSLSETLTRFYPWAGRLSVETPPVINCNDEGAHYIEARANFTMAKVLQRPQVEELKHYFIPTIPADLKQLNLLPPLLLVQLTLFGCGGFVIGISVSHSVTDGASGYAFFEDWSRFASGHSHAAAVVPDSSAPALSGNTPPPFPGNSESLNDFNYSDAKTATRFVFDASKVRKLKAIAASDAVPHPSKTEVVSALLWKCSTKAAAAAAAARTSTPESKKNSSFLASAINIRRYLPPQQQSTGNIFSYVVVKEDEKITELMKEGVNRSLHALVGELREQRKKFIQNLLEELPAHESSDSIVVSSAEYWINQFISGIGNDWFIHSSLCGMNFYGIDFGFGKPILAGLLNFQGFNTSFFVDSPDGGGVEAWVQCLKEEEIFLLEQDPELLEFASVNPSPLGNNKETSHSRL